MRKSNRLNTASQYFFKSFGDPRFLPKPAVQYTLMSYAVQRCDICDQVLDDDNVSPEDPDLCDVCADSIKIDQREIP